MSQFHGRMQRVARYGPRCSIRFGDRYAEMLAPDYISPMFGRYWEPMRKQALANLLAPNPYAVLSKRLSRQ